MASLGLLVLFTVATIIVVGSLIALALVPTWPMLALTMMVHTLMSILVVARIGQYADNFEPASATQTQSQPG